MGAFGWVSVFRRYFRSRDLRGRGPRRPVQRRKTVLHFDALEKHVLLSTMTSGGFTYVSGNPIGPNPSNVSALISTQPYGNGGAAAMAALQSVSASASTVSTQATVNTDVMAPVTITQTVSLPTMLTNFTNQPLLNNGQGITLFNPALGTLTSVSIKSNINFSSLIQTQNTSRSSPANPVVGSVQGAFSLNNLNQAISANPTASTAPASLAVFGPPFTVTFQPPSGITFPTLTATDNQSFNLTDPASLAFYTATAGHTSLTPTLTASAVSTATAPNGNLTTQAVTSANAQVTITYTYTPVCAPAPTVVQITHTGIHHQQTHVIIQFQGQVNAQQATNTANYVIVTRGRNGQFGSPGSKQIPVTSAVFDPATDIVTLTTGVHLNVHQKFQITINIPNLSTCGTGTPFTTIFGGKGDLGPELFHGKIIKLTNHGPIVLSAATPHAAIARAHR
jgi:hypothetical protein